jgi:hypothetical protein
MNQSVDKSIQVDIFLTPRETLEFSDALSLEYKLQYGCATRDLDIADIVNDPVRAGVCSILSLGFEEIAALVP